MDSDRFHIGLKTPNISIDVFRTIVEAATNCGFSTARDGTADMVDVYSTPEHESDWQDDGGYDVDAVFEEIRRGDGGRIKLWIDDHDVSLGCHLAGDAHPTAPELLLWFWRPFFESGDHPPQSHVDHRIEATLELVRTAVPVLAPVYGCGHIGYEMGIPEGRPVADAIERIGWLTVLHPDTVERLGGADHVTASPAWRIETFETGHVMLVASENPYPPSPARQEIEHHMLGADDVVP